MTRRLHPSFGGLLSCAFVLAGTAGVIVWLTPSLNHLWLDQNLPRALEPPGSRGHLLGTDGFGRDSFWRLLAGTGVSLAVSVIVVAITIPLGLLLGSVSGYRAGRWDERIGIASDVIWTFPLMLVVVIATSAVGMGLTAVVIGVAAVSWAGFARVIRSQVIGLRDADFVSAARLLGVPERKVFAAHVLPQLTDTVLVMAPYYASVAILTEAAMAFIGFGAQPPTPSLGDLLADGRNYWSVSRWQELIPGVTLCAIVLGLNGLGDMLRDRRGVDRGSSTAVASLSQTGARH